MISVQSSGSRLVRSSNALSIARNAAASAAMVKVMAEAISQERKKSMSDEECAVSVEET
jgi:hypothetical protein